MEKPTEIIVESTIQLSDVYSPFDWNLQNLVRWVLAILAAYIVYDICFSPSSHFDSLPDAKSIMAVIITLAVFIILGLTLFPYLRIRALLRKAPGFNKPVRFAFTSESVRFESENATGDFKWITFSQVIETSRAFALSQTGLVATYVPKRCFASEADIATFRQLVRDHFKGKYRLRRA
jgi:hypothetical protein